jgi:hypothetical protein
MALNFPVAVIRNRPDGVGLTQSVAKWRPTRRHAYRIVTPTRLA